MRAKYNTKGDRSGELEHPVIIPQAMQHADGFTLLGFDSWEDVNDEKICAAVTDVSQFHITKEAVGY